MDKTKPLTAKNTKNIDLTSSLGGSSPVPTSASEGPKIERIAQFVIERELGRGGMGIVYQAYDETLGRKIALKLLPAEARTSITAQRRFEIEVKATAKLSHPHIVPVYGVDEDGDIPFYAMKLINGSNLASMLQKTRESLKLSTRRAARSTLVDEPGSTRGNDTRREFSEHTFIQDHQAALPRDAKHLAKTLALLGSHVADALDHAHENGIIHRDIKPSNLLIDEQNKVWVSDFGLAHLQGAPSVTVTGQIVGTLRYMSPEQASGQRAFVDHRTDIYSLGATLYELATLKPMCEGTSTREILRELTLGRPTPLRRLNSNFPKDFETVLCKATERDPVDRYATAKEMADDLLKIASGKRIETKKISAFKRIKSWAMERPGVTAAVLGLVMALSLSLFLAIENQRQTLAKYEKMRAGRMVADVSLRKERDPGGAIGVGLLTPDIEQNGKGLQVLMQAIDQNHEAKTIPLGESVAPGQIAWSPGQDLMIVCPDHRFYDENRKAQFIDTKEYQLINALDVDEAVTSAAFSAVGSHLVASGSSFGNFGNNKFEEAKFSTPLLWNVKERRLDRTFPNARIAECSAHSFSSDGNSVALPNKEDAGATIYGLAGNLDEIRLLPSSAKEDSMVMGAVFSRDQRLVVTWAHDGHVAVYDSKDGVVLKEWDHALQSQLSLTVAFSNDSQWMQISSDRGTKLIRTEDWDAPARFRNESRACFVGPNHDVVLLSSNVARLYDPGFGQVVDERPVPEVAGRLVPVGNELAVLVQRFEFINLVDFSNKRTVELRGHSDHVIRTVAPEFASGFASVGWDGTVRFWNAQSDQERRTLDVELSKFTPPVAGYSPDSTQGVFGTVNQFRTSAFSADPESFGMEGLKVAGRMMAQLPNGQFLTAVGDELQLRNPRSGRVEASIRTNAIPSEVEVVQEDQVLIRNWDDDLFVWDCQSKVPTKLNRFGDPMKAVVVPGKNQILATSGERLLAIDLESLTTTVLSQEIGSRVFDLKIDPGGQRLAIVTANQSLLVWNLSTQKMEPSITLEIKAIEIEATSEDGLFVVHEDRWGGKVEAWDVIEGQKRGSVEVGSVRSVELATDKPLCLVAGKDGVLLWDLNEPEAKEVIDVRSTHADFAGDYLVVATQPESNELNQGLADTTICQFIDAETFESLAQTALPFRVNKVQGAADEKQVFLSGTSWGAEVVDLESRKTIHSLWGQDRELVLADFYDEGKSVVTVSSGGKVMVSELLSGQSEVLGNHGRQVTAVRLMPDRAAVLVADETGRVAEWDLAGRKVKRNLDMENPVIQLASDAQGKLFAAVHAESVSLWDRESDQAKSVLKFDSTVKEIALNADGSRLLCILGEPKTYVPTSRLFGVESGEAPEANAFLVDLESDQRVGLDGIPVVMAGRFYDSGKSIGLLCRDGSMAIFDANNPVEDPQVVRDQQPVVRLIKVADSSPVVFASTIDAIVGWDIPGAIQRYELSGVVSRSTSLTRFNAWRLPGADSKNLVLPGPDAPVLYPRKPVEYARQIAPRELTPSEKAEFDLR